MSTRNLCNIIIEKVPLDIVNWNIEPQLQEDCAPELLLHWSAIVCWMMFAENFHQKNQMHPRSANQKQNKKKEEKKTN